jgi:hypothetical protein
MLAKNVDWEAQEAVSVGLTWALGIWTFNQKPRKLDASRSETTFREVVKGLAALEMENGMFFKVKSPLWDCLGVRVL